jgi:hypothetical protein
MVRSNILKIYVVEPLMMRLSLIYKYVCLIQKAREMVD